MIRPLLALLLCTCASVTAQERSDAESAIDTVDVLSLPVRDAFPDHRPIVYGHRDDGYPDSLVVVGVVEDAYPVNAYCSGIIGPWSGTVAVRLDDSINFRHPVVYVALECLAGPGAEELVLGRRIEVVAHKLYDDTEGFGMIWNRFEMGEQPLYGAYWGWQEHLTSE